MHPASKPSRLRLWLLLLSMIVHGRLRVDDHRLRVVAPNLHIPLLTFFGMPRRCEGAKLLATSVLKTLQLKLILFGRAAGAALIRASTARSSVASAPVDSALAGVGTARTVVGRCEAD